MVRRRFRLPGPESRNLDNFPTEAYSFEDCFLSFTGQTVDSWTAELSLSDAFTFFPGLGDACPVN